MFLTAGPGDLSRMMVHLREDSINDAPGRGYKLPPLVLNKHSQHTSSVLRTYYTHTHTPRRRKSLHSITAKSSHEKQEAAGFFLRPNAAKPERWIIRFRRSTTIGGHVIKIWNHFWILYLWILHCWMDKSSKLKTTPRALGNCIGRVFFFCVCVWIAYICMSLSICLYLSGCENKFPSGDKSKSNWPIVCSIT